MKHEHAELKLTITPQGLKRTDLLALPDSQESEKMAIWLHSVLAQEIHRFRNNTKSILRRELMNREEMLEMMTRKEWWLDKFNESTLTLNDLMEQIAGLECENKRLKNRIGDLEVQSIHNQLG
jgi:ubiquinone biosynthesis protein UbiJ